MSTGRSFVLGFAVLIIAWLATGLVFEFLLVQLGNEDLVERIHPYNNAHLLEESSVGSYSPLRNRTFLLGVAVNAALPLLLAIVVVRRRSCKPYVPLALAAVAIGLFAIPARHVLSGGTPQPMRSALLFEVIVLAVIGIAAATVQAQDPRMPPTNAAEP